MGEKSTPKISAEIAKLRTLSRQQLLELWGTIYRKDAPEGIRRELLVPFLAYKIQEDSFGGLKSSTRAELRRIARELDKSGRSTRIKIKDEIKPGTRLQRQWQGQTHEIAVTDAGFEYRGARYKSLSQIARKITGTRWSGPAFFGLRKARCSSGRNDG
jgi:hypothetical protein